MESIYDIMKDRLQVTEPTFLVTSYGPRQGDRTIYNQDGDILYGDAIEGFTLNRVKTNALCVFGSTECFVEPVEKDPSVLVLGAGHVAVPLRIYYYLSDVVLLLLMIDLNMWCLNSLMSV